MLIWVVMSPGAARSTELRITDDTGHQVTLARPAMRIIALYGAYGETVAAMGLESRLVARTSADTLPQSIRSKPSVGTHMRPNVEMVLGLKPDLIIQGGGRREAMVPVTQLRGQGLPVAVFSPETFAELFSVIEKLGVLTGATENARELVAAMQARLDRVKIRVEGVSHRPRVFFEVRYPNLLAAGKKSMVDEVIERAGGVNCIEVEKKLVRINMESIIACRPDVYVVQRGSMNRDPGPPSERPNFSVLQAVKYGRVTIVDEQVFSRPGPRSVDAVEELARFLNPGIWTDVDR